MDDLKNKNKAIKKVVIKLIQHTIKVKQNLVWLDFLIKQIEYIRGLYRYPNKMIGRKMPKKYTDNVDVLVFAAHPDDEVLGLGTTLNRHRLAGDSIKVIFTTNGTGRGQESWYLRLRETQKKSDIRSKEAKDGLAFINVTSEDIFCLGYPDRGSQRYIKNMTKDVFMLIDEFKPKRIYVHCIEGGHVDHDITSFVVKSVCNEMGFSNVFEWTEYNPFQELGTQKVKFLSSEFNKNNEIEINISEEERELKRKMLASHISQDMEQYYLHGEAIRLANISHVEKELLEFSGFSKNRTNLILKCLNKVVKSRKLEKENKWLKIETIVKD